MIVIFSFSLYILTYFYTITINVDSRIYSQVASLPCWFSQYQIKKLSPNSIYYVKYRLLKKCFGQLYAKQYSCMETESADKSKKNLSLTLEGFIRDRH